MHSRKPICRGDNPHQKGCSYLRVNQSDRTACCRPPAAIICAATVQLFEVVCTAVNLSVEAIIPIKRVVAISASINPIGPPVAARQPPSSAPPQSNSLKLYAQP